MKVKDLIKDVCIFIGREDLTQNNIFDTSQQAPSEWDSFEINRLVAFYNNIYKEIATCYLPLFYEEEIEFVDGIFEYSNLEKNIIDIYKLKNVFGENVVFEAFPTYIKSNALFAKIVYSFCPSDVLISATEDINFFGGKILPQVIIYGIAREFALLNREYTEAEIWNKKFKENLLNAVQRKTSVHMKNRGWF